MDTRELLTQLERLEFGLDSFSFSELNGVEASQLKKTFEAFKSGLEEKVFGESRIKPIPIKTIEQVSTSTDEGKLIANVSHEIRTPLNGIVGFLELLKETDLTQQQLQLVNAMDSASKNLLNLINELLEFSSLAAGHEKFEKVPFNLENLVNEMKFLCQTLINDKSVNLTVKYDESIPKLLIGDPSKLSQVLLNLLGNAIKFVDKGDILLEVKLKRENNKKVYLEFVVADTGIGIANENLKHIFKSYQQAEPNTKMKYGGSGLGLSIVKEIIDKQHGCLAVSSTIGEGTTFRVILPYERTLEAKPEGDAKPESNVDVSGTSILVIEDDILTQTLMRNRLDDWGCSTIISNDAFDAFQQLENHHVDLILLDMHLPGMNGLDFVHRLRQHPKFKPLPIIVLSGDVYSNVTEEFIKLNISDFILKPYESNELLERIHKNVTKKTSSLENKMTAPIDNCVDTPKIMDLRPILTECMGKTDLLDELIRLFKQNVLEFIGKTKMHLQAGNIQGVGFAAHKIKSSLKMLHAESLGRISEQIISECRNGNDAKLIKSLFDSFVDRYPAVETAIDLELNRIKYDL